jgi:hypothetical protein
MEKVLSDGTRVVLWDAKEMPQRSARIIERTSYRVRQAIERMRGLADVPADVLTLDWWQALPEKEREAIYFDKLTEDERTMFDASQDATTVAMVKQFFDPQGFGRVLTVDDVSDLPGPIYRELSTLCAEAAGAPPDFSSDGADDPLARTDNSD